MNSQLSKQLKACILASLIAIYPLNSFAITFNNQNDSTWGIINTINNGIAEIIDWLDTNLIQGNPFDLSASVKGNSQMIASNKQIPEMNNDQIQPQINQSLVGHNSFQRVTAYANLLPTSKDPQSMQNNGAIFNIGNIINKSTINIADVQKAQLTIDFVTGASNPITGLPSPANESTSRDVLAYKASFGSYITLQSVGANVLQGLLNERIPQNGLGAETGSGNSNMSPLGLDEFLATRRIDIGTNSAQEWTKKISTANQAQVNKEQLMLMAEMRYEAFEQRMQLEQLNATMAALQLELNQSLNSTSLNMQKSQVLNAN